MAPVRTIGHIPALDGLRAIAVTVVVIHHLEIVAPAIGEHFEGGFLGVDVFFVLSGFLITALLLREITVTDRVRFGGFFTRRAARLLPALALLLAADVVYAAVVGISGRVEFLNLRSIALYYYNWDFAWNFRSVEGLGHLWSLSVEEQFYLVWPFVVVALTVPLRRRPLIPISILAASIVVVAVHRIQLLDSGTFKLALYVRTDTRADALLIGALLAYLWTYRRTPSGRAVGVAGLVAGVVLGVCFVFATLEPDFLYRGGFTLVALSTAMVMLAVIDNEGVASRALSVAPARMLGRVSYGVYLWHLPVMVAVRRAGPGLAPALRVVIALTVTAIVVAVSWVAVERPALRWSDRRRTQPTARTIADPSPPTDWIPS